MEWIGIVIAVVGIVIALHAERRARGVERQTRRARIVVVSTDKDDGAGGLWRYQFHVRNVGHAPAADVQVWLTDHRGRKVSSLLRMTLPRSATSS